MAIIGKQLQALGHKVVWETSNEHWLTQDSGINLVVEGFIPASTDVIHRGYESGARFICIATEEPTLYGFNHGRDKEMIWRQVEFPNTAKYFDGILYLVPGAGDWYKQWAPSAYVELGYAPSLVRTGDIIAPCFDFGFFGSLSRRRLRILKALAKYIGSEKAIRVEASFPDQVVRDRIMREARVIVQIRKHEEMGLVSSSRCNTALCLGRPVVAEPHLLSKPWDEVVKFSESSEAFFQDCLMARSSWQSLHYAQFMKFREKMTPDFCVGRALREIGLNFSNEVVPTRIAEAAALRRTRNRLLYGG
jgi:hypothetical protein